MNKPFLTVIIAMTLSVVIAPTLNVYAFTVWNVNMNKTVTLPIKPIFNQTTITDTGSCGYDGITALKNVAKEKAQNLAMFKSDLSTVLQINENDTKILWCGIVK